MDSIFVVIKITLSSGTFTDPGRLLKSMKVYGQGYIDDSENGIPKMVVSSNLLIGSNDANTTTDMSTQPM